MTPVFALAGPDDVAGFWCGARAALAAGARPEAVRFTLPSEADDLFLSAAAPAAVRAGEGAAGVPASGLACAPEALAKLIEGMLLHSAPERFALAYRLLWRARAEPALAAVASDPDVAKASGFAKAVRRDLHKMKAFVRFRADRRAEGGETRYVAWFEPAHHIVRAVAPFFVGRFTGMRWSILTPQCSAHWDRSVLSFSGGASRADVPQEDPLEDVWRTYYGSTFNPARLKVKAMTAQMPKKYWHNLPEAEMIAPLVRAAQARSAEMIAAVPKPARPPRGAPRGRSGACAPAAHHGAETLAMAQIVDTAVSDTGAVAHTVSMSRAGAEAMAEAGSPMPQQAVSRPDLAACTRCSLHACATQVVPGEGPARARLMLVGEQPGDAEDLAGRPFVGPAGTLLSTALERAGIVRAECYLTNAVKHFKFEPRGKRRIHTSPSAHEIDVCRWWLDQERARVAPRVIVALGVSAVRGLTGRQMTLSQIRSRPVPLDGGAQMLATVHPAFLLRLSDAAQKRAEWHRFLADLRHARDLAA